MLADAGIQPPGLDDLSTALERQLGELVANKYGTDLYFLDRFPSRVRPFYTMPCPDKPELSNSYDIFLRGEEICSGAQRIHDAEMLEQAIVAKGVPVEPLRAYVDSMRHGMPPHGGAGIGLERLVRRPSLSPPPFCHSHHRHSHHRSVTFGSSNPLHNTPLDNHALLPSRRYSSTSTSTMFARRPCSHATPIGARHELALRKLSRDDSPSARAARAHALSPDLQLQAVQAMSCPPNEVVQYALW